jgi:hypothetical protein
MHNMSRNKSKSGWLLRSISSLGRGMNGLQGSPIVIPYNLVIICEQGRPLGRGEIWMVDGSMPVRALIEHEDLCIA